MVAHTYRPSLQKAEAGDQESEDRQDKMMKIHLEKNKTKQTKDQRTAEGRKHSPGLKANVLKTENFTGHILKASTHMLHIPSAQTHAHLKVLTT